MASRKIFVGSLPHNVEEAVLRTEFSKYGSVEDIFIKQGCELTRQWAFITFLTPEEAQFAKESCDRVLVLPGGQGPCDVMVAKNQGMFGQGAVNAPPQQVSATASKKIFVGSLPDGMPEAGLRDEFSKYGMIEDIYLKQGCESGRQWAFITFSTPDQAQRAVDASNKILMFEGAAMPCEVTLARNQGMFGQGNIKGGHGGAVAPMGGGCYGGGTYGGGPPLGQAPDGPRKIFIGSLPDDVTEILLRAEFSKYGQIVDCFVKEGAEPNRKWAFMTFASGDQAAHAKQTCDRVLTFPGALMPCEVTIAKNQGMFGKETNEEAFAPRGAHVVAPPYQQAPHVVAPIAVEGPRKIFVGSLPDSISDGALRGEFAKYGQVVDTFLKQGCEPGRQWAFITFATAEQAAYAKDATDRVLFFQGATQACEVMLAKNQGKNGQAALAGTAGVVYGGGSYGGSVGYAPAPAAAIHVGGGGAQPPPPSAPPPPHLTAWRMYKTASGLPYYHNSSTGVTQWECPPELQVPGQGVYPDMPALTVSGHQQRHSPY